METNLLNPMQLFQFNIRYTIPAFQRRYVWEQEEQWEPLWDDVRNTAESYLEEMDRSGGNPLVAANNTAPHFLGAVVIQQVPVAVMEIQRREVIDGQQRMTTLQLLLDAIQQVCEELELKQEASHLSQYVTNNESLVSDNDHIFKLWPTTNDREAFRHAMDNGLATDDFEESLIVQAHEFFQLQARQWLNPESNTGHAFVQSRATALQTAVTVKLQMVVIDLMPTDDPHVIFETLNARGTPLEESELIKNYAMSRVRETGIDDIWGDLSDDWWRREISQGRLLRPRIDMLLNYWLTMRNRYEISPRRIFREFKNIADKRRINDVMSEVQHDLGNYRRFQTGPRTPDEDIFHYRIGVMQTGVITPVLIILLSAPYEQRIKSLKILESFLVRRMVCRASTKDYNRLTMELSGELQDNEPDNAARIVVDFLRRQIAESRKWPDDTSLTDALENLPLYRMLTRGRLRLVLEGVEERLRKSSMSEQHNVPKNLTIEHVMPQGWRRNWNMLGDLDEDEGEDRINNRNRLVHTIGNLTLITQGLNSTLSNGPWESKREILREHSVLLINDRLLNESYDTVWDEDFIEARSKRMAKLVAEVWPGPESSAWDE